MGFDITKSGELKKYIPEGNETTVVVPDGVKTIGMWAFKENTTIKEVTLPNSVTKIDKGAFNKCSNLISVNLPDSITRINDFAFSGCEKLSELILPSGIKHIGVRAFYNCHSLSGKISIPEKGIKIGTGAFSGCENLENENGFVIFNNILFGYYGEEVTTLTIPNGVKRLDAGSLYGTRKTVEEVIIPNSVTEIGHEAFENCEKLTKITLPQKIKNIGAGAFSGCKSLIDFKWPENIQNIPDGVFSDSGITSFVIPDGVTEIGEAAFSGCKNLSHIIIPNSVSSISYFAFSGCESLIKVKIPENVTELKAETFKGCSNLEELILPNGFKKMCKDTVADCPKLKTDFSNIRIYDDWFDDEDDEDEDFGYDSNLNVEYENSGTDEIVLTSEEAKQAYDDLKSNLEQLGEMFGNTQNEMEKYGEYLNQKEAREKEELERKAKEKAEALAKGKTEADVVNMFVILLNEKMLGNFDRNDDEFYEIYEEDFLSLSKSETIKLRKNIKSEMQDEMLSDYYSSVFKKRSVEDRFAVSTRNLLNVTNIPDYYKAIEFAIDETKIWYLPEEYPEVKRLMNVDLADLKNQLDEQLSAVDEGWTRWSSVKSFLRIVISDKSEVPFQDGSEAFQTVIGDAIIRVRTATDGFLSMGATVLNCQAWYWGVTISEIWETAFKTKIVDEREDATDTDMLANQAVMQMCAKFPSKPKVEEIKKDVATNVTEKPVTETKQKEGCYIATAVYGSYDAPEVIVLRRFRDEVLQTTYFGRLFVRFYYKVSPPIADKLKNAKHINGFVRSLLNSFIKKYK